MATKKNVKVRDLKPTKDAKGGGTVHASGVKGPPAHAQGHKPGHAQGTHGPSGGI